MKKGKYFKKKLENLVELEKIGECSVEDVDWLCSLSESEIDMLISLKVLIIQRAERIGHKKLANKFDLKVLRAIALVLMEYLKAEVKDSSLVPDMVKSTAFLDACNLLKCNDEVDANIEELNTCVGADLQPILKRSPALVLMEYLKAEVKDSSLIPDMVKSTAFLDACNLLKCNDEVDASIEELNTCVGADLQPILKRSSPALVLMEYLKAEVKDSSLIPDMVKSTAFLDACNLLKCNDEVDASIEELNTCVGADLQPILKCSSTSKQKKRKVGSRE